MLLNKSSLQSKKSLYIKYSLRSFISYGVNFMPADVITCVSFVPHTNKYLYKTLSREEKDKLDKSSWVSENLPIKIKVSMISLVVFWDTMVGLQKATHIIKLI